MAILPLRTKVRGPAPADSNMTEDIIDEALTYFKPLTFFRQYEFKVLYLDNISYIYGCYALLRGISRQCHSQ